MTDTNKINEIRNWVAAGDNLVGTYEEPLVFSSVEEATNWASVFNQALAVELKRSSNSSIAVNDAASAADCALRVLRKRMGK